VNIKKGIMAKSKLTAAEIKAENERLKAKLKAEMAAKFEAPIVKKNDKHSQKP
jgi:hypothetical protein